MLTLPSLLHRQQRLLDSEGRIDRFKKKYKLFRSFSEARPSWKA